MGPEGSLPCSQEPSSGSYPEPEEKPTRFIVMILCVCVCVCVWEGGGACQCTELAVNTIANCPTLTSIAVPTSHNGHIPLRVVCCPRTSEAGMNISEH
jgi:hypothetical protein